MTRTIFADGPLNGKMLDVDLSQHVVSFADTEDYAVFAPLSDLSISPTVEYKQHIYDRKTFQDADGIKFSIYIWSGFYFGGRHHPRIGTLRAIWVGDEFA